MTPPTGNRQEEGIGFRSPNQAHFVTLPESKVCKTGSEHLCVPEFRAGRMGPRIAHGGTSVQEENNREISVFLKSFGYELVPFCKNFPINGFEILPSFVGAILKKFCSPSLTNTSVNPINGTIHNYFCQQG